MWYSRWEELCSFASLHFYQVKSWGRRLHEFSFFFCFSNASWALLTTNSASRNSKLNFRNLTTNLSRAWLNNVSKAVKFTTYRINECDFMELWIHYLHLSIRTSCEKIIRYFRSIINVYSFLSYEWWVPQWI